MNRRDFLKTSAVATAALAGSPLHVEAGREKPTVRRYQELGKTGLKMSDISLGCSRLPSSSMVLRAVDRGINYLDTAPDYGQSELYIGEAMKKIRRDKIILASKMCKPMRRGHLRVRSTKKDYIDAVEGSLTRLKTDYLDVSFIHALGSLSKDLEEERKRLLDEEMLAAVEVLKKAGKVRFLGMSSHGPNNMEQLVMIAVQSGHFDVIMPAFNFMQFPNVPEILNEGRERIEALQMKKREWLTHMDILKEAKKRGVGVVAMKTLAGARDLSFDSKGKAFEPAALKWVLSHPEVSGLVVTIKTVSQLDRFLTASGRRFSAADQRVLNLYAENYGQAYCRTGCNQCESECPQGVEIATSLRYQMYFRDYGMEKGAMESYAALVKSAEKCLTCENNSCDRACPYGLPLKDLLREAHETLSFPV